MKRTAITPGKPLERRTPLKRIDGLQRDSRRRVGKSRPRGPAYDAWRENVIGKPCACCGRPAVDGHHVIYAQHLRANAREQFMWDLRNQLPVCRQCHDLHHSAHCRIPWGVLRRETVLFARMLALGWLLEREYPLGPLERTG